MTPDRISGLTDAMIERMLVDRSGSGAPSGFVESIVSAAGVKPQLRTWGLPSLVGRRHRALAWSLIAIALALLAAGAAVVAASLLTDNTPDRSLMLVAQLDLDRTDGEPPSMISIFELDPATRERLPIATVPITSGTSFGTSMRALWAPDHRHALLFDDLDELAGILDMTDHVVTPFRLDGSAAKGAVETTWSPAGDRFAWLSVASNGSHLVITDITGERVQEIALPAAVGSEVRSPRWSPDGSTILVGAGWMGCCGPELLSVPIDGGPIRTLLDDSAGRVRGTEWSPDGSVFAFESAKGITTVDADGRQAFLTHEVEYGVTWSPDGSHIAFVRFDADALPAGIVISAADRYVPQKDLTQLTDGRDSDPVWSPDGRSLVFSRDMGQGDPSVWVVSIDGGPPTRLVDHARADW